jgi:DNA-binding transcriptional ArsR family regulator
MAMSETDLLKEISQKLSQLITLTRLSSSEVIAKTKEEIKKDSIAQQILTLTDGSLSTLQLVQKVATQNSISERTVQRRIADLLEKGALDVSKKGNVTYYENSGLYE